MPDLSTEPDTTSPSKVAPWCETCSVYMTRRAPVLVPAIVTEANRQRIAPPLLAVRYLAKVHARHLAGLSLEVSA